MRHVIVVVGSREQLQQAALKIEPREGESQRETTWYACRDQQDPGQFLDDLGSVLLQALRIPFLAYSLYQLVHSTKLWSGKRPLLLIRGRGLSSRVAAYAGTWGGGDVVAADLGDAVPLGPTRYILRPDGKLIMRSGDEAA